MDLDIDFDVSGSIEELLEHAKQLRALKSVSTKKEIVRVDEPTYDWDKLPAEEQKREVDWSKATSPSHSHSSSSTSMFPSGRDKTTEQEYWWDWSKYQSPGDVDTVEETIKGTLSGEGLPRSPSKKEKEEKERARSSEYIEHEDWDTSEYFNPNWSSSKWESSDKDRSDVSGIREMEKNKDDIDLKNKGEVLDEIYSNTEILVSDVGLLDDRVIQIKDNLTKHHQKMVANMQEMQKYHYSIVEKLYQHSEFRFNEMQIQINIIEDLVRQIAGALGLPRKK
jgi:hypothetical protein